MCFYVHPKHPKQKTAKRNITCWKVGSLPMEGRFHSGHRGFRYIVGKKYFRKRLSVSKRLNTVNAGLHSYSTLMTASNHRASNQQIVQCVIPRGAKYYYNHLYEEYVSTQIVIVKAL